MPSRPLRVLIADDNRDTVMMLGILLRSEGMDVRLAIGGAEVQAAVGEFRPDAVLLDITMPDRSGLQVALELVRDYGAKCPVLIAVTAHATKRPGASRQKADSTITWESRTTRTRCSSSSRR